MASCWGSNSINLRKRSAARIRAPNMCVNTGFSPKPREQFSSLRSSTNNPSSVGPSLARRMGDRQTAPTSAEINGPPVLHTRPLGNIVEPCQRRRCASTSKR